MSCVHDIIAISGQAVRAHIAYKDAPDVYRHTAEDVAALQVLINKVAQHLKSTNISSHDRQYGQKLWNGCHTVLADLNSFIEKYKRLAAINKGFIFGTVKLGNRDITALHSQLISQTVLMNSFIRSCEYNEVQAQLTDILGLHGANSRVSVTTIASFAANPDTDTAYRQLCKDLERVGVLEVVMCQKKDKILEILRPLGMVAIGGSYDNNIEDQDLVLETAYEQFCKGLYEAGMTKALMPPKDKILELLKSRGMVSSSQTGGSSSTGDKDNTKVMRPFMLNSREKNWFLTGRDSLMPKALNNSLLLHLAASNCHSGTVKLLFGKDAFLDQGNNTFLHCAAACGYTDTVKLLLDKGAPIEAVNTDHDSPLHLAAQYDHAGVVELLLREGASLEAINKYSFTPLHTAAFRGHTRTAELLIVKGALIENKTKISQTPLHTAAKYGHTALVELLLGRGASLGAMDQFKQTPLHLAADEGRTDTVELLLSKGALTESKGHYGCTPLHGAAGRGSSCTVRLLLGKGASIEARNEYQMTPLHLAARGGYPSTNEYVVELLLSKGASIEARDKDQMTPLHCAARLGHTYVVEVLLKNGASFEAKDKDKKTPLQLAVQYGHTKTAQLLENKAAELGVHSSRGQTSRSTTTFWW